MSDKKPKSIYYILDDLANWHETYEKWYSAFMAAQTQDDSGSNPPNPPPPPPKP